MLVVRGKLLLRILQACFSRIQSREIQAKQFNIFMKLKRIQRPEVIFPTPVYCAW